MNYIKFSIIGILIYSHTLLGCPTCITQVSKNHSNLATKTIHAPKNAQCNCQCKGERSEKNECLECGHIIIEPQNF